MSFRDRIRAPRVNLLLRDFKDRRDGRQRRSYAAIGGLAQRLEDRRVEAKWRARVAENERQRRALSKGRMPEPIVHRLPREIFVPTYLRVVES